MLLEAATGRAQTYPFGVSRRQGSTHRPGKRPPLRLRPGRPVAPAGFHPGTGAANGTPGLLRASRPAPSGQIGSGPRGQGGSLPLRQRLGPRSGPTDARHGLCTPIRSWPGAPFLAPIHARAAHRSAAPPTPR